MVASFASIVRQWADVQPSAPAVTAGALTLDYQGLDRSASQVANALMASGVTPGARVGYLGRNSPEYAALMFGASKARAALTGLNWRLAASEMAVILDDARPEVVVSGSEFLPELRLAMATAGLDVPVIVHDGSGGVGGEVAWAAWVAGQPETDAGLEPEPDDVALVFYTSGTTGKPKGVMIGVGAIDSNLTKPVPWVMQPGSVVLIVSPVFHTAGTGWTYLSAYFGAHTVLLRDPDPAAILHTISEQRVTHALLVPAIIQMLLQHPEVGQTDFSSLETVAYGASPIAASVLSEALVTFGCDFVQAYGMTETNGPITYLRPEDHDPSDVSGRLRSAGRATPGIEVKVVDTTTLEDAPVGAVGEVWARNDQFMSGYFNKPDETAETLRPDGWLRTGDGGYLDADGYLYLTDRIKDMIVSGAENVYPAEVENVVLAHPAVADAAVIGVPSERWGETVKAVVVARPDAVVDADELIAFCRERLAHYKCPTSVAVVDVLPRNPAGKVLRRELREPYWAGHGRSVG